MDKSDISPTTSRYTYQVITDYSVMASSEQDADEAFKYATEEGVFSDSITISRQLITRNLELKDRGEKTWIWNQSQQKWELTRFNLN